MLEFAGESFRCMDAVLAKQWLWYAKENFETELLLSQSLSFKEYKMYITVIFMHLVLELFRNKILR